MLIYPPGMSDPCTPRFDPGIMFHPYHDARRAPGRAFPNIATYARPPHKLGGRMTKLTAE